MKDHMYLCDGPAQFYDERALQALQGAASDTEDAVRTLMEIVTDLPFVLRGPITADRVKNWVDSGVGDARRTVFENTVWGTIRWDRSLGEPSNVRGLYSTFSFNHWYLGFSVDTQGEPTVAAQWQQRTEVRAWDGPHDEQNYRVSFMLWAVPGLKNRFWPAIQQGVIWEPREMIWPDSMLPVGDFRIARNELRVLDEYRVVRRF